MTGWRVLGGRTLGNEVRFWFWLAVGTVAVRRARKMRRRWAAAAAVDPRGCEEARAWRGVLRATDRVARVRDRLEVYR